MLVLLLTHYPYRNTYRVYRGKHRVLTRPNTSAPRTQRRYIGYPSINFLRQRLRNRPQPYRTHTPIESIENPFKATKRMNEILPDNVVNSHLPDPPQAYRTEVKLDAPWISDHPGMGGRRCFALRNNRWQVNNALDLESVRGLQQLFKKLELNHHYTSIIWRPADEHLCPGEDLIKLHKSLTTDKQYALDFYKDVLKTVHLVSSTYKPWFVALDGNVMGVGAGLALHFSVPLAIDTSAVAMPGCLYGFTAATAGMSYILSRLPHNLGEYLALTGKAIRSSDLVHVGLAKMFTPGDRMDLMEAYLGYVEQHGYKEAMEVAFLFAEDPAPPTITKYLPATEAVFSKPTVHDIMLALRDLPDDGSGWVHTCLDRMKAASPLSLAVTLRAIRTARFLSLEECLQMEWLLAQRFINHPSNQFARGIEYVMNLNLGAQIMQRANQLWPHADPTDVKQEEVNSFFAPATEEERLKFEKLYENDFFKRPPPLEEYQRFAMFDPARKELLTHTDMMERMGFRTAPVDEMLTYLKRRLAADKQLVHLAKKANKDRVEGLKNVSDNDALQERTVDKTF